MKMGKTKEINVNIFSDKYELGQQAGTDAASLIKNAIREKSQANIILATGTSQFETLKKLISDPDIDWSKVVMFHLDEYIGLPETSPASFRKYLRERVLDKLPTLKNAYLINGETTAIEECKRVSALIQKNPIDVALVGIGENGHLAFNDPPANFETEEPYIIVKLDQDCRQQQLYEGWFKTLSEVPEEAISMSIRQILKSRNIICSVPDSRKATAVKNCLENGVNKIFPASILKEHPACNFYLDRFSSSKLNQK